MIDHLPFGGTCALRGCDPKKVLVGAAEAIDHVRRMRYATKGPAVMPQKILTDDAWTMATTKRRLVRP